MSRLGRHHVAGTRATLRRVITIFAAILWFVQCERVCADVITPAQAALVVPLAEDGRVEIHYAPTQAFTADARVEVVEANEVRQLPRPTSQYFTGTIVGQRTPSALLETREGSAQGFVAHAGNRYVVSVDRAGAWRSAKGERGEPAVATCHNGRYPELAGAASLGERVVPRAAISDGIDGRPFLEVRLAIETDNEFLALFPSTEAAVAYVGRLIAAANLFYSPETRIRLRILYLRLWAAPDPWVQTTPGYMLGELRDHWLDPSNRMDEVASPRAATALLSGKASAGGVAGVAYTSSLCGSFAYSVTTLDGTFSTQPELRRQFGDIGTFVHEFGHNAGSPHTHCYDPPVDKCFNQESDCYAGPIEPSSDGTIMSYCHTLPGGLENLENTFGPVVAGRIRSFSETRPCLLSVEPVCGDGVVDPEETCDDGNAIDGDGCSMSCQAPIICGDGVLQPGEYCDDANASDTDGCRGDCMLVSACGDELIQPPTEECDAPNNPDCVECRFRRPAAEERLTGTKLVVSERPSRTASRRLTAIIRGPVTLGEGLLSPDDPALNGGTFGVAGPDASGIDVTFALPQSGWRRLPRGKGYQFQSSGSVRALVVKRGKLLRLKAKGPELPALLTAQPTPLSLVLTLGQHRYCVVFDRPRQTGQGVEYVAVADPATSPCPGDPAALPTSSTSAASTSTSTWTTTTTLGGTPIATTTTTLGMSTVTTTSTVVGTTTVTTTTLPMPTVCCELDFATVGTVCADLPVDSESTSVCSRLDASGQCDGATGTCKSARTGITACCQLGPGACFEGPSVDESICSSVVTSASCSPSGTCDPQ